MSRELIGDAILLFVTLSWGITFPLIGNAVDTVDPFVFVTVRFLIAALILLPLVFTSLKKTSKEIIIAGLILGALNAVAYTSQTTGMLTLTSAETSFITGISVVIVPFILPFFSLGKPTKKDMACSLLCLLGLFFLLGTDVTHFNSGAAWVLLCAFAVALTIVYLQKVTAKLTSLSLLAFYQILFTALFCSPFTFHHSFHPLSAPAVIFSILFCATFGTSIALLLQTKYQRYTTANRAAMIFCFEPIFGSLFGYLINGEKIGWPVLLGGMCIFTGLMLSFIKISRRGQLKFDG